MYKFNLMEESESTKRKVYGWYQVPDETYFEHHQLNEKGRKYLRLKTEPNIIYTLYGIIEYNYQNAFDTIKNWIFNKFNGWCEQTIMTYLQENMIYDYVNDIISDNPELDEDIVTDILENISNSIISYYDNKKVDIKELDNMLSLGEFVENAENEFYN